MNTHVSQTSETAEQNAPIAFSNWIGVRSLYYREVWRFLKVWNQTVASPIITSLLWLFILTLALGGRRGGGVESLDFDQFVAPGLIMMSVMTNAFANPSSSLVLSKLQGAIVDVLMPPHAPSEVTFCLVMGGVTRGVVVGVTSAIAMSFFVDLPMEHPLYALFFLIMGSMLMSTLGMIGGIWAQGFDQLNSLVSYIVTPLSFLSGTFYSISILPGMWYQASLYNPFFYMIDGLRYGVTGYHDGSLVVGATVLVSINVLLLIVARNMVAAGWRLKT